MDALNLKDSLLLTRNEKLTNELIDAVNKSVTEFIKKKLHNKIEIMELLIIRDAICHLTTQVIIKTSICVRKEQRTKFRDESLKIISEPLAMMDEVL